MSLSFVASAVQTATADGGFEETKIESKQNDAINQRNSHKPLFEQLRNNQEEEQAKQEEAQREAMRGTRALDDEDVAHLDAIEKQRRERQRAIQQRMQDELLQFRAARAERQQRDLGEEEDDDDDDEEDLNGKGPSSAGAGVAIVAPQQPTVEAPKPNQPQVPKIVVKKRKRKLDSSFMKEKAENKKAAMKTQEKATSKDGPEKNVEDKKIETEAPPAAAGLGGLLSGYGSSDDDSDQ